MTGRFLIRSERTPLKMGYFWAQGYAQVIDSLTPSFQNDKTGDFTAKTVNIRMPNDLIRLAPSTRLFLGRCARTSSAFSAPRTSFTKPSRISLPRAPAVDLATRCLRCFARRLPLPPSPPLSMLCLASCLRPCRAARARPLKRKWPASQTR